MHLRILNEASNIKPLNSKDFVTPTWSQDYGKKGIREAFKDAVKQSTNPLDFAAFGLFGKYQYSPEHQKIAAQIIDWIGKDTVTGKVLAPLLKTPLTTILIGKVVEFVIRFFINKGKNRVAGRYDYLGTELKMITLVDALIKRCQDNNIDITDLLPKQKELHNQT